jgi:hypothetical protein
MKHIPFMVTLLSIASVVGVAGNLVEGNDNNQASFPNRHLTLKYPPSISRIEVIDTAKQKKIQDLYIGSKVNICKTEITFRAKASTTESVVFGWDNNEKFKIDNNLEYTLCGDKDGKKYHQCNHLKPGFHCISATPFGSNGGTGKKGKTLKICFDLVGCKRKAPIKAPKVPVKLPTKAPVMPPTNAPVKPPTKAPRKPRKPQSPPTVAPLKPPTKTPRKQPTNAPIKAPTKAPQKPPTVAPVKAPTKAPQKLSTIVPVKAPTKAPRKSPIIAPVKAPTKAPRKSPTIAPVKAPTKAPRKPPTVAPIKAPTKAPLKLPTAAPVRAPTKAPRKLPTVAPVKAPTKAPRKPPTIAPIKPY